MGRQEAGSAPPMGWPQAHHGPSPGLGLPMARGRDWIRWSLGALLAVAFPAGTGRRRTAFLAALLCARCSFHIILGPPRSRAVLSSTDQGASEIMNQGEQGAEPASDLMAPAPGEGRCTQNPVLADPTCVCFRAVIL